MKNIITALLFLNVFLTSCQTNFNKTNWIKQGNELNNKNSRIKMIDDLFENHLKQGIEKKEIIQLLGNPLSDTISVYLPKNISTPDSLSFKTINLLPIEKKKVRLKELSQFYQKKYKKAPVLTYFIGYSFISPNFLFIKLKDNKMDSCWIKQN